MSDSVNGGVSGSANVFGVNVYWTVPELAVEVEKAHAALKNNGFDIRNLPAPSRRVEVSRAVYSLQNRQGKADRRVTEIANSNGVYVTYGILDQDQVSENEVGFKQMTTVKFNKATGDVQVEGKLVTEVYNAILYFAGRITDDDVRGFLRRIIRSSRGIAKRPTGGIYFVPGRFAQLIERAQAVLNDMGAGAKIYVEGVVNGIRERENVWDSVQRDIGAEIELALNSVAQIERSTKAVKGQQLKLEGLQDLMDIYTELLGEEAKHEELAEKLAAAVQTVSAKMAEMQGAAVAAPAAPTAHDVAA